MDNIVILKQAQILNFPPIKGLITIVMDSDKMSENYFPRDPRKQKRDINFFEISSCIVSSKSIPKDDPNHSIIEKRNILIALSSNNRILRIVFCKRNNGKEIRIISAHIASQKDKLEFKKMFGEDFIYSSAIPLSTDLFLTTKSSSYCLLNK